MPELSNALSPEALASHQSALRAANLASGPFGMGGARESLSSPQALGGMTPLAGPSSGGGINSLLSPIQEYLIQDYGQRQVQPLLQEFQQRLVQLTGQGGGPAMGAPSMQSGAGGLAEMAMAHRQALVDANNAAMGQPQQLPTPGSHSLMPIRKSAFDHGGISY